MHSTLLNSLVAAMALVTAGPAIAMGGSDSSKTSTPAAAGDQNYARAKSMIEASDYKGAVPLLQQVVAKDARNADAYNLLGYATRKSGDPNGSLQYYNQALSIDPKHVGALEYLGEAYLQLNRLPEAEQQLAKLDSACVFGCLEQRTLKTAIANYKAGKKPTN
jgi:tetratricopeptide (TPR) repeat protein